MTNILDNLARLDDTRWQELDYKAELWPAEPDDGRGDLGGDRHG